jgi:hypothetical protein
MAGRRQPFEPGDAEAKERAQGCGHIAVTATG